MPLSQDVTDVADKLAADLRSGTGSRQTVGAKTIAFGWVSGLPVTLASFVTTIKTESLTVPFTRVLPSVTPVAPVASGAAKPNAIQFVSDSTVLVKHAGFGEITLEQSLDGDGLLPAVVSVLGAGALLSFETSAMAVLDANNGQTATGTGWAAALANGQAKVLGAGGVPGVIVVSSADYGAVIAAIIGNAGFAADPASAVGSYLGSALHVSPALAAGKAFVLDPSSVVCIEHESSPLLITDPYSQAANNKIRLVADLLAAAEVLNDKHVVEVTAALTQTAAAESSKKK